MLICNGDSSFKCGNLKTSIRGNTQCVRFDVFAPVSPNDIKSLFADSTFYFYDDVIDRKLPYTDNTKLVGLNITFNTNSTCNIKIKLIKGDVDYES